MINALYFNQSLFPMAKRAPKTKKYKLIPGILIHCKSGRYLAYYKHRSDILANGDTIKEARKNLREAYEYVIKIEGGDKPSPPIDLPADFKTSNFTEKFY
jgi:predicted RNase H-like HicB family nuclease